MERPWLVLLALGAIHGLNPAMGWLFAVARGMQEGSSRAVWRSLLPLAGGHGLAIVATLTLVSAIGAYLPLPVLKWTVAGVLLAFGCFRLVQRRHPRFGGMQVGGRDLTIWSFLMASAHGAGLMVVPFALPALAPAPPHHGHYVATAGPAVGGVEASLLHTAGYVAVTALLALVIYHKVGLGILRRAWINVDALWTGLILLTAVLTPFL
jgi:hypothetical protein